MPVLSFVQILNENLSILSLVVAIENVGGDLGFAMVILLVAEIYGDLCLKLLLLLNFLKLLHQSFIV
jgi:hypothetical protein